MQDSRRQLHRPPSININCKDEAFKISTKHKVIYQEHAKKTIFIVVFPTSSTNSVIKGKIHKICEALGTTSFTVPKTQGQIHAKIEESKANIQEIGQLLSLTISQIINSIDDFFSQNMSAGCSSIEEQRLYILREKQLYIQLNKLKMQGNIFIGQLWVPTQSVLDIENCLTQLKITNPNLPAGQLQPIPPPPNTPYPTFFKLNDFTSQFQEIVDLYGVPRYQELNPAIFTCMTFPFFFGIMFGDIGHGLCLLIIGIYLINNSNRFPTWKPYRYMITLMGAFSFYIGFVYNEFFGLQLNLFGSCYVEENKSLASFANSDIRKQSCTYPFGIDPVWQSTLSFTNSYKMKLSVIIAYLQMTLGLVCSGLNYIYFNDKVSLYGKFIPQVLLLTTIFGYMDFLIIYKWAHSWMSETPPSIINILINMVTKWGFVADTDKMWDPTGNNQQSFQQSLMWLAILSIPWMWLSRILSGIFLRRRSEYQELSDEAFIEMKPSEIELELRTDYQSDLEMSLPLRSKERSRISRNNFDELIVHESIETIEYVLGTVSNTASYLRLWALSLAHSQLAEVFYQLILSSCVENGQIFDLLLRFPAFFFITIGVLLCMDSLECFLHSLRLHWQRNFVNNNKA